MATSQSLAGPGVQSFLMQARKFVAALSQRAALVLEPRPAGVSGPPLRRLIAELDVVAGPARRRKAPAVVLPRAQTSRVVMLMPGFATHPIRMRQMARRLEASGHVVKDWKQGVNLGPTPENFENLVRRLQEVHDRYGEKVCLVGWSLGGIFARELAKVRPDLVEKVITMGSPFSGDGRANNVWRIYHLVTGHSVDAPPIGGDRAEKPPVPTIAFWSARDGMIHPRAARGKPGERDRAQAVRCSHMGFCYSEEAVRAVLVELDRAA